MKITTALLIGVSALFLNACGGNGDGGNNENAIDRVDNSIDPTAQYNGIGYYGSDVILGNHTAAGTWELTIDDPEKAQVLTLVLDEDTNGHLSDPNNVNLNDLGEYDFSYGITKDGKVMNSDEKIEFTLYSSISASCYNAHIVNDHVDNLDDENVNRRESFDVKACKK